MIELLNIRVHFWGEFAIISNTKKKDKCYLHEKI